MTAKAKEPGKKKPAKKETRGENECDAARIQEALRDIVVEVLRRPHCAADIAIGYLISCINVAGESGMLQEFAAYAATFPNWLQAQIEEDAGVADWPHELEEAETRGQ